MRPDFRVEWASVSRPVRWQTTSHCWTRTWTTSPRASPRGLELVTRALRGDADARLAADAAIARCREHPIPVLSAAASVTAARRAARVGAGLLFDSLVTPARARALADAYRDAGGTAACVMVRRAWLGAPPSAAFDDQVDVYRGYTPTTATTHWGADEMVVGTRGPDVAEQLLAALGRGRRATRSNVRVHVPGVTVGARA